MSKPEVVVSNLRITSAEQEVGITDVVAVRYRHSVVVFLTRGRDGYVSAGANTARPEVI
jgi:hypothetical protein